MQAIKTNEQKDGRANGCTLDDRYGEIGISAVAAAVRRRTGETTRPRDDRFAPRDSD
jgi:hypothetical protein